MSSDTTKVTLKKGKAPVREKMNMISEQQTWASHCEKEDRMEKEWFGNWGEVYFPNRKTDTASRVAELEAKAEERLRTVEATRAARAQISLEPSAQHKRTSNGELRPAYPFT